jgi:pimeloyl-ACP methyl ester carboxylesterase
VVARAVAAVLVAAVFVIVGATLAGCTPPLVQRAEDDIVEAPSTARFYVQPDPLPSGGPGALIRSEHILGSPLGSSAWRIMFHSTDLNGRPVVNTGLVVVPVSPPPAGGRTIVSWGHPTTGVAQKCAPSRAIDPFDLVEGLTDFLNRGYIVVYTDYTGMGTPGPDSYLVGGTAGRNMLDAARAARQLLQKDAGDRVVLWGHSQGGQAALFAAQLAPAYAPELRVLATAVAAPATDLANLLRADIGDISGVSISSYAFDAYSQIYGYPLQSILTPAAIAALPAMNRLCLLSQNAALHAIAKPLIGGFLAADPATTQPWAGLLAANTPGGEPIASPLYVAQGEADELVRPASTDAFVARVRAAGTAVTYDRIPGATHGTVALRAQRSLFDWLHAEGVSATG